MDRFKESFAGNNYIYIYIIYIYIYDGKQDLFLCTFFPKNHPIKMTSSNWRLIFDRIFQKLVESKLCRQPLETLRFLNRDVEHEQPGATDFPNLGLHVLVKLEQQSC